MCCIHVAEKKSICCFWGKWTTVFMWSLGPSGGLFSFAFHFHQSGPSIERLDFNQWPLLIAVCDPCTQLVLYADETMLFLTQLTTNAGPTSSTPPH